MSVRPAKRFSPSRFLVPFLTLLVICYFAFHAFHGQYGIQADLAMQQEIDRLELELSGRVAERKSLSRRVTPLVSGSTLDRDMVDEHVRRQLNVIRQDEVILSRDIDE